MTVVLLSLFFLDHPANASCSRESEHYGYYSEWLACFQGVGNGNTECPHAFTKIEDDYGVCGGNRVCCLIQPTLKLKVRMEKLLLKYTLRPFLFIFLFL